MNTRRSDVPSDALRERILAGVAASRAATTRTRTRIAVALATVTVVAIIVVVFASEVVYGQLAAGLSVNAGQVGRLEWTLLLLAAMTLISTFVAVSRGKRGFGLGAAVLAIGAALVAPVYAMLTAVQPIHMNDAAITGVTISPWGARCALIAAVIGITAMACFTSALRRAVPVASGSRGAAIGAAAGAWAGLAVFLFCPSGDPQHLILGHLLPVIALTLMGALATPALLRP
jgi:hypothetical protein